MTSVIVSESQSQKMFILGRSLLQKRLMPLHEKNRSATRTCICECKITTEIVQCTNSIVKIKGKNKEKNKIVVTIENIEWVK